MRMRALFAIVTCFALAIVALGIGYHEYDAPYWISTGWLIIADFYIWRMAI